ncbi:MAG TPA: right-handed parallel beta-helix repeat-containing protein [Anaerolineales bacterium]|nr:right-handed parallel beta-helix repeat-containing protein [Anaerolineales bacterium]
MNNPGESIHRSLLLLWVLIAPTIVIGGTLALFERSAARAGAFTVDTTGDTHDSVPGDGICADANGDCSLRAAIEESNRLAGANAIVLSTGTFILTEGQLWISDTLHISGETPETTIISAQSNSRAITIDRAGGDGLINVFLENLTVRDALVLNDDYGGGIVSNENVSIQNAIIRNNRAANGAGVMNIGGKMLITDTLIIENDAVFGSGGSSGGGVYTGFGLTKIISTTIANNHADFGGGLSLRFGTMIVQSSSITGNTAEEWGGGVRNQSGIFTITLSTIDHNKSENQGNSGGAAILNEWWEGQMWLIDSRVLENAAPNTNHSQTGGILNSEGRIEIIRTEISRNTGTGLENANFGTMIVTDSTIADHVKAAHGGQGIINSAVLTVTNSTISGNDGSGTVLLGTMNSNSSAFIGNSTISDNRTTASGGGVYASSHHPVIITHSTIAFNMADSDQDGIGDGGGIYRNDPSGPVILRNTLVANNLDAGLESPDCGGLELESDGYNLIASTVGCIINPAAGDLVDLSISLGPLADWGGPTFTHALLPGTQAIEAGVCTDPFGNLVSADQRGVTRPQGAGCDIGAFEYDGSVLLFFLFLPVVQR